MKKAFKNLSLVFVAILTLFMGVTVNAADPIRDQTFQAFTFDISFQLRLGDLTKNNNGSYNVPITAYASTNYTNTLDISGEDEIHYRVSEITEAEYNTLKEYQDDIDELTANATPALVQSYQSNKPTAIATFEELVRNGDTNGVPWWCYDDPEIGTITIPADCETKYYIVVIDVADTATTEGEFMWNHHTARVYKVDANKDAATCNPTEDTPKEDTSKEENPKTGVATPYIICGAVALVSIVVIASNKKKKYI